MSPQELKPLLKTFKKFPDAFWRDVILISYQNSVTKKIGFTEKSIEIEFNKLMHLSKGKLYFEPKKIQDYLIHLEHCGYIEKHLDRETYFVTKSGYTFLVVNGGSLTVAKRTHKENRRFDFEYFKMGYDTIISLLAFVISIIALIVSLKQ